MGTRGVEPEKLRPKGWKQTVFPPSGSAATEALLDDWVDAKRTKDFQTADKIRDQLREHGIVADSARPRMGDDARRGAALQPVAGRRRKRDVEEMLEEWVQAKRAKQFDKADSLREALQAQGIDAESA